MKIPPMGPCCSGVRQEPVGCLPAFCCLQQQPQPLATAGWPPAPLPAAGRPPARRPCSSSSDSSACPLSAAASCSAVARLLLPPPLLLAPLHLSPSSILARTPGLRISLPCPPPPNLQPPLSLHPPPLPARPSVSHPTPPAAAWPCTLNPKPLAPCGRLVGFSGPRKPPGPEP